MRTPWDGVVEWRSIPSQNGYIAGSDGTIVSLVGQYNKKIKKIKSHIDKTGYSRVNVNGRSRLTHKLVADAFGLNGMIDHIDRNRGNASLVNLRQCTRSQNMANMITRNKTGFKGVSMLKTGKYSANIRVLGKLIPLGSFHTPEQAHMAYRDAASKYFGEFAFFDSVKP
jgi:hypothetical protein